jgi:hypothetical protein
MDGLPFAVLFLVVAAFDLLLLVRERRDGGGH